MKIEILDDAPAVARRAAEFIAAEARAAVAARGRFCFAVSGGSTPWLMLRLLAAHELPWPAMHLFQVDERVAPAGDGDRNLTHIGQTLLTIAPAAAASLHPMPVEGGDLEAAARDYARTLARRAGEPPVLDLVHLGLGVDGHTASLVPGDGALSVHNTDVAITAPYQGRRRMTLTFPVLDRARCILWLATGSEKREMLARLRAADPTIPAGRVAQRQALVLTDRAAAGG